MSSTGDFNTSNEIQRFGSDTGNDNEKVYVGGRKSVLAIIQTQSVASDLSKAYSNLTFPVLALSTLGDQVQSKPLYSFGGKSLWTTELESLLLSQAEDQDHLDMIVHSLKDMPTALPETCTLGAVTKRQDPRDAVIMKKDSPYACLKDLPDGSVVGTSSVRRSAQLRRRYPNLKYESIRGNLQTRLSKLDAADSPYSCIILAVAGLIRLDMGSRITSYLSSPDMYYAVGQGALGVEIRSGDEKTARLLQVINDKETSLCCEAERSLMRTLEGGCSVPIGVETAYSEQEDLLTLRSIVISVDGTQSVEEEVKGKVYDVNGAVDLGRQLAKKLINAGAKTILDQIRLDLI